MDSREGLTALRDRVAALKGEPSDYDEGRRIEYEMAVLWPPMSSPDAFLRDARDPAMLDHIVKMDVYDGIPRWTADLQAASELVQRLLPAWQWVVWGGAIEIGHTRPRCFAEINDGGGPRGGHVYKSDEAPTPPLALLHALLSALSPGDTSNG